MVADETPEVETALRALVADEEAVTRLGVRALLERRGVVVVAECFSRDQLLRLTRQHRPDLAVCDLDLAGGPVLEVLPQLCRDLPATRFLVLAAHACVATARAALAAGACGYTLRRAAVDHVADACLSVAQGRLYVHPQVAPWLLCPDRPGAAGMSERELAVLQALRDGLTSTKIAARLHLSLRTVEAVRASLRRRLGAADRAEVIAAARRLQLLD